MLWWWLEESWTRGKEREVVRGGRVEERDVVGGGIGEDREVVEGGRWEEERVGGMSLKEEDVGVVVAAMMSGIY